MTKSFLRIRPHVGLSIRNYPACYGSEYPEFLFNLQSVSQIICSELEENSFQYDMGHRFMITFRDRTELVMEFTEEGKDEYHHYKQLIDSFEVQVD